MQSQALREFGSFARRNKLSVAGGLVGLFVVLVALTARRRDDSLPWV